MKTFRRLLYLGWLPLLGLTLSACAGTAERVWLNAPGWNRARLVASTQVVDPVSMALDDEGGIYLFLIGGEREAAYPRVMALNRRAEVIWDRSYEAALKWPDQSQILWDGQALQLFWLSNEGLYNAQLQAATGDLSGPPVLLSGENRVASYAVAEDPGGSMSIWYAGPQDSPGLYTLPPGDPTGDATLVDSIGMGPNIRYDDAGTLHASWMHYPPEEDHPKFYYAAYEDGLYVPGQETKVLEPFVGTARVYGPLLGLDGQQVYLLWTVMPRIGPRAGMATTHYLHLPPGQPASASPDRQLSIPYTYHLPYQAALPGGLEAGPRVPLPYRGTDYISAVAIDRALAPELVIAFHTKLEYLRRKEQGQVSTVFFQGGAPVAYQQISFSPGSSDYPAILSDKAGHLYATWLEGAVSSGYNVYFASTAPDIRDALSRLTLNDIGQLGPEMLFGLLGGVMLAPLALIWVVAPLVILGLTSLIRRTDDRFTSLGVILSLALALVAYWASKLAFMPGIEDYVPFSAWLPFIPPSLNLTLRLGVPLLVAVLALGIAWRSTYGRDRPSILFFLLMYVMIDGVFTLAVYGPIFYAAF